MATTANFDQTNRPFRVTMPDDVTMFITAMVGEERMSRPFEYKLSLLTASKSLDYTALLGKAVTVELDLDNKSTRYWNGLISRLEVVQTNDDYVEYRITLVPWLSILKHSVDCKIYQNQTAMDVVKAVFQEFGFSDFAAKTTAPPPTMEYIVQYRETAFDFVNRLLEQAGIYYYFTHENGKHTLVLCDGPSAHSSFPSYDNLEYSDNPMVIKECLRGWGVRHEIKSGKYTLNDYDFTAPKNALTLNQVASTSYSNSSLEVYEYPGLYTTTADGTTYAGIRLGAIQAGLEVFEAKGTCRGMACGSTFSVQKHPSNKTGPYLTTATKFELTSDDYQAAVKGKAADGTEKPVFAATLEAIDNANTFRPPAITPRPIIAGPQTATVTGPSGEEIYTDSYGRIKVQFNWDRDGKSDENTTCFMRVAQSLAGIQWGSMYLPRIGMEVVVTFLEGNPDRPLVTGCVYNAVNTMVRALPANKNITYLRTNSTKKGNNQFNEMGWDDTIGSENHFTTAQKDVNQVVNNNQYVGIGQDSHLTINNDQYTAVGEDHHDYVKRNRMTKVDGDVHQTLGGKLATSVAGKLSLSVTGDVVEVFSGNHSEAVTSNHYLKAENVTIEATNNLTLMVGDHYIAINSSGIKIATTADIVIDAANNLTMSADSAAASLKGATGIALSSSGGDVTASGINVTLTGQNGATLKGTATATVQGASVSVQGSASTAIKGGIVQIN